MKIVREQEIHGDHIEAPNKRVIKHLSAPWTLGSRNLWVGTSTVEPGNETNAHSHEEPLKSVCSVSPPFEVQQFRNDHDMENH